MKQYIEKAALMDHVEREGRRWGFDYDFEQILGDIEDFQIADVRPVVRGRWLDYDDDYGAYCCSVCEQDAPEDTQWPYCPHCGADMREGKP